MTINRVQGTVLRVEDCKRGGQHVLTRARQVYCDRCRPKESREALERQRRRRGLAKPQPATAASQLEQGLTQLDEAAIDPLMSVRRSLAENAATIERLAVEAKSKILSRAKKGQPISNGLAMRHAHLVSLHQQLEAATAQAAQLSRPPTLRDVGATRQR